ncbi:zinc knuckle CX2CX4HX4C containing protein [Tanacetum coccineum]
MNKHGRKEVVSSVSSDGQYSLQSITTHASKAPQVESPIVNKVVSFVNDGSSNSDGPNGSYVSLSNNVVELNTRNDNLELKAGNDGVPGIITSIDDTQGLQDNEAGVDVGIADVAQADEHAEVYLLTGKMQVPVEYPTGPVPNLVEGFSFMEFGNVCVPSSTAQKNYTNTSQNGLNDFVNGSFTVGTSQLHNGDTVATIFGVPLKSLKDIDDLTRRIEAGECEDVMSAMTNDERKAVMDEIVALWEKLLANESTIISLSPNEDLMGNSGGGNASANESHIVNSVVEAGNARLKILCMVILLGNGLHSRLSSIIKGLEDVLETRPWMIRKSPIILKKWTINTSPLKEELTRIPVWVNVTPPKSDTSKKGNIGVRRQGTMYKSQKTTSKETFLKVTHSI